MEDSNGGAMSRAGSREASLFFFGCFFLILLACLCGVYVVHAYWNRRSRQLMEERRLEEERNNPWTIRERYERGVGSNSREGSNKEGSVFGGSIVRGFMYGLYVLNPSGSFSFGSSRVETNEKEVKARKKVNARASTAVGASTVVGATAANASYPGRSFGTDENSQSSFDVEAGIVAAAESARDLASFRVPSGDTESGREEVPDPWAPETRGPLTISLTGGGDEAGSNEVAIAVATLAPVNSRASSDRRVDRHSVVAAEALMSSAND